MSTMETGVLRPFGQPRTGTMAALIACQTVVGAVVWSSAHGALVPGPAEIAGALGALWSDGGLGPAIASSVGTSLEALAISTLVALPLAYVQVIPAMRPVVALLTKLRFLGFAGLTFVFTLAVGGGHPLKVALLAFGMGLWLLTGVAEEVAQLPRSRFAYARSLRLSGWSVFREVVVLGTLDRALELIRQNAAMGWTLLTFVEVLVRSEGGVGTLLSDQNRHFHLAEVFAIQLAILAVGVAQDAGLGALRKALCPYAEAVRTTSSVTSSAR